MAVLRRVTISSIVQVKYSPARGKVDGERRNRSVGKKMNRRAAKEVTAWQVRARSQVKGRDGC